MIKEEEVRSEGCICEPSSDISTLCKVMQGAS